MAAPASRLRAGAYIMQVARLSLANYPMGVLTTPDSPLNGTQYSPYIPGALVEYRPGGGTTEEAESFGNQQLRGRKSFGKSSLGVGTVTFSEFDDTFDALVMGYTLDTTTATAARLSAMNARRTKPRRFMVSFSSAAVPADSSPYYDTVFKLNVTFDRDDSAINSGTGRNPNNVTYNMYISVLPRTPFGQLFSASTVAPEGNADAEYVIEDTAPIMWSTYVDDHSATTLTMPFALDYTEHAGAHNIFYKNGTDNKANVSSVTGAALTITAGTAADIWVVCAPSTAMATAV